MEQEVVCHFPELRCGEDNGSGTTPYGDVWVPALHHYRIPLAGDPTRPDRPGDMYEAALVGAEKDSGPATAVAINGIQIQGPNDAGDVSIDEGGFQVNISQKTILTIELMECALKQQLDRASCYSLRVAVT